MYQYKIVNRIVQGAGITMEPQRRPKSCEMPFRVSTRVLADSAGIIMINSGMLCSIVCADTLAEYNQWLEEHSSHTEAVGRVFPVHMFIGFLMGFRRDHPILNHRENQLLDGGFNLHQGAFVNRIFRA